MTESTKLKIIGDSFHRRYNEVMEPISSGKRMSAKKINALVIRGNTLHDFAMVFLTAANDMIGKED